MNDPVGLLAAGRRPVSGWLETRVYTRAGIDAVACGPGPMEVMHAPDENIPAANLLEACTVYAHCAQALSHAAWLTDRAPTTVRRRTS